MRQQIEENFINKAQAVTNIVNNEVTDIDGWANCTTSDGKQNVTVLGGYLGQLMIVLNALAKFFPQIDRPPATPNEESKDITSPKDKSEPKKQE